MRYMQEMSYEDIAVALNVPVGTVKTRLHRAQISMRDFLMQPEHHEGAV